jgi:6-phosphogluconolactonase (cycloisomerase 2 family)
VTPPPGEVVSQFNVYRWNGSTRGALVGNTSNAGGVVADSAVTNGTSYQYIATALNTSGEGPDSAPIGPVTPAAGILAAPALVLVSAVAGNVVLSWGAPSGAGVDPAVHYNIYRSTSADARNTGTLAGQVQNPTLTFTDPGQTVGTTYFYAATTLNHDGVEGSPSADLTVTPAAGTTVLQFAYSCGGSSILQHPVTDAINGKLGPGISAGGTGGLFSCAAAKDGRFVYATVSSAPSYIQIYSVNPTTGVLTPTIQMPLNSLLGQDPRPDGAYLDPTGHYLFTADSTLSSNTGVTVFAVDTATGNLTEAPGSPYVMPGNAQVNGIVASADASAVYLGISANPPNNVLPYTIVSGTGQLIAGAPVSTSGSLPFPESVAITPDGQWLFVGTFDTTIQAFQIISPGVLNSVPATSPVVSTSAELVFDPSGAFAYAGFNSLTVNNVVVYSVDLAAGLLTQFATYTAQGVTSTDVNGVTTGTTGMGITGMTVDPTGQFLYATSNFGIEGIDGFRINGDGSLTHLSPELPVSGGNTDNVIFTTTVQ